MNEQSNFLIKMFLLKRKNVMNHCLFSVAEYITSFMSKWENHSFKAVTESKSKGMQTLV